MATPLDSVPWDVPETEEIACHVSRHPFGPPGSVNKLIGEELLAKLQTISAR